MFPGEKAKELLKKDKQYLSPSYFREYPTVIEKGEGMYVFDVDGNKFLDFGAGYACCSTGHSHPEVVRAIERQAKTLLHIDGSAFLYPSLVNLGEKLAEITPGAKNKRVFFGNSGTEAVEAAMKLSRYATKRQRLIAFYNSFHGRTYGGMSLTASKWIQRKGFAPLVPGVTHIPYPYCYRCQFNLKYPSCNFACIDYVEDVIFHTTTPPEEVAALFVEPIQGEGGYIIPPDGYFERLKKLLDKYNILFVADEIQSGMGRTGKMFAIEHWNVIPDMITIAKGIASGMPISALVARASLMDWETGAHASTFGGNPVACEAALVTIKLLEEKLVENAKKMGYYLIGGLHKIAEKYPTVGDVRGKGLMIGCEIVKDKSTKEKAPKLRDKIIRKCFENGLLLLGCGACSIRFSPPLVVEKTEIDKCLEIFDASLKE
ncbi:acetyl ornithine aminotransferase family protein [candidate division WOR-3 bacterium]|nr:acetyl ornithine aminotransferase family protein [candidate division WOR-3 bacterium]